MRIIRLYLENFMCYDSSELDFTNFNSALIIGTINGNDLYSNGTGKSTLFKAIEFVIFNRARELNLEKIIRDDTAKCKVYLDFENDGKIYRVQRIRTVKGVSDLSLFERSSYEDESVDPHSYLLTETQIKLYWNNISGRRTSDTEEELKKIHKISFEAFLSANHFVQNDFSGLPTATAGQRKKILKDALQIVIYNKLEKLTGDEAKIISKEIDKKRGSFNIIGDPKKDLESLQPKIVDIDNLITIKNAEIDSKKIEIEDLSFKVSELAAEFNRMDSQSSSILKRKNELAKKVAQLETESIEAEKRKKTIHEAAKALTEEIKSLNKTETDLKKINVSSLDSLKNEMLFSREQIVKLQTEISNIKKELDDLRIPLPNDSLCKHCRQPLTDIHRQVCRNKIEQDILNKEEEIKLLNANLVSFRTKIVTLDTEIKKIEDVIKKIESVTSQIFNKKKEYDEKKKVFEDYVSFWEKAKKDFELTKESFELAKQDAINSSEPELNNLRNIISDERQKIIFLKKELDILIASLAKLISDKAVFEHSIGEKQKDLLKKTNLEKEISSLDEEYIIYPDVVESFGPRGIPNLIIQDVLDELQVESNNLLAQLKPGLQLSFSIEKTKGDGELDDDLEINYFLNNKPRDYGQLSGAMKLCVMFSLKLGLSFLLKKKVGANIKFLLIDEIDQSLDKAGIDAFADIIKFFQKDFIILVITHNDRLKSKFTNVIVVDQDRNMVSNAQVITPFGIGR